MPKNGFTLVEILIITGMMAIIGVIVFANFRSGKEEQILQKSLFETQSVLRLAQSNASASVVCDNLGGGSKWQVVINSSTDVIDLKCFKAEDGSDVKDKKTYTFDPGVDISLFCPGAGDVASTVVITYPPYSGLPKFEGSNCEKGGLGVKLTSVKDNTIFKQFIISSGGAINAK